MRVFVTGTHDVAKDLRSYIRADPDLILSSVALARFRVTVKAAPRLGIGILTGPRISGSEQAVLAAITQAAISVLVEPGGGDPAEDTISVELPVLLAEERSHALALALYKGLLMLAKLEVDEVETAQRTAGVSLLHHAEPKQRWWVRYGLGGWLPLLVLLALPGRVEAQIGATIQARDLSTGAIVPNIGDTTNNAIRVNVVAGSGGGATGTIGSAVPATVAPIGVKDNSGNLAYPKVDASGNLLVAVTGASGGTSSADGAAYVASTTTGTPSMAALDDAATTACAEDKVCIARLTAQRGLHVNLRTVGGTELGTASTPVQVSLANTAANATAVKVDGSAVTQPTSLATLPALTAGSAVIGHVIADTGSTTAVTGNVTAVQATGTNLHAVIDTGSTTAATQATAANLNAQVQGAGASGATKAGNPVQTGGIFNTTQPTVTTGQTVEAQSTARGAQIVAAGVEGLTVTANAGTNLNTSALALDATLTGRTQKAQLTDGTRDGTVKAASTLPALTDTAVVTTQRDPLPAGTNVIGHVINDTGSTTAVTGNVTVAQATGTNLHAVLDTTSTTAVTQATGTNLHAVLDTTSTTAVTQATAANLNATVTQQTLTKGTQGATGVTTQALIDSGRTMITLTAERVTPILTTDTIVTMAKLVGDTVTAGITTYAVSSGKTLRITSLHLSMSPTSTTVGLLQVRLRTLSSGACTVAAGKVVGVWEIGNPLGTVAANQGNAHAEITIPEGLEFSGATRNVCISANVLGAAAQAVTITLMGYEY